MFTESWAEACRDDCFSENNRCQALAPADRNIQAKAPLSLE